MNAQSENQQLQCYACGLPKVHPEFDVVGSYGKKIYNHSCEELMETMKGDAIDERFIRTCPVGVKSCFGATGFYDHDDSDPSNDICKTLLLIGLQHCLCMDEARINITIYIIIFPRMPENL